MLKNLRAFLRGRLTPLISAILAGLFILAGIVCDYLLGPRWLPSTLILWSISALPLAAMFYWVRRRHRLSYGIAEIVIALVAFYALMLGYVYGPPSNGFSLPLLTSRTLTLLAAVYVMVRAYDNIGEGLAPASKFGKYWNATFPK